MDRSALKDHLVCQACPVSLVLKAFLGWLALSVLTGLLVGKVIKVGRGPREQPVQRERWENLDHPVHQAPRAIRDYPAVRVHRDRPAWRDRSDFKVLPDPPDHREMWE